MAGCRAVQTATEARPGAPPQRSSDEISHHPLGRAVGQQAQQRISDAGRAKILAIALHSSFFLLDTLQRPQIDQHIDERVLVGDRALITQVRTFNAEGDSLAVDAFYGGALVIETLELGAFTVEGMPDKGADAGGQGGEAALVTA